MTAAKKLAREIEENLRAHGSLARAEGAKRYLKSDLEFIGVATPDFRRVVLRQLKQNAPPDRDMLCATARALWARPVFELRAAAAELLMHHVAALAAADIALVEELLRDSHTWALVDNLAPRVAGPLLERHPGVGEVIDRWARDDDFWLRRAALLTLLLPLRSGGGDFERFGRYADTMLDDGEFFIRKAIGWVLREVAKKRPQLVIEWLRPRLRRVSGVTLREAVRHLPTGERETLLRERAAPRRPALD